MRFVLVALSALAFSSCGLFGGSDSCKVSASGTATASSTVTVDYVGTLDDGSQFDQGSCSEFSLQRVVPGFREGIVGMNVGDEKTFSFPPEKGYGDQALPGIPPNSTLTFEVKLYSVR